MKRLQVFAQVVGFVIIGLFFLYGIVAFIGGPDRVWAATGFSAPETREATQTTPTTMNYQGMLRGEDGLPLSGSYTLTFKIYPSTIATQSLWSEVHTEVTVREGHFGVLLGDSTPLNATLFASPDRYIGVTVAPFDEMLPRQRLVSVPYTFYAQRATQADQATQATQAERAIRAYGLSAADNDPADAVTVDNDGDVTVGGNINAESMTASGQIFGGSIRAYGNNPGWGGLLYAGGYTSTVMLGQLNGHAALGGHSGDLSAWSNLLINPEPSGNVGIGTYHPTQKLDVNGSVNVNNNVNAGGFTTNGGISAGNLSVSGDIGWSGNLTSINVTHHWLQVSDSEGGLKEEVISGVNPDHSACFVSHIAHNEPRYTVSSECKVGINASNQWEILVRGTGNQVVVGCGVRCIEW